MAADCPKNTLNLKTEGAMKTRSHWHYGKLSCLDQNLMPNSTRLPSEMTLIPHDEDSAYRADVKKKDDKTQTISHTFHLSCHFFYKSIIRILKLL